MLKFEKTAEDWTRTEMQFHDDYYFISIDNGDIGKVYWEFDRRTEDGQDIYYTETGYKFLFDIEYFLFLSIFQIVAHFVTSLPVPWVVGIKIDGI